MVFVLLYQIVKNVLLVGKELTAIQKLFVILVNAKHVKILLPVIPVILDMMETTAIIKLNAMNMFQTAIFV